MPLPDLRLRVIARVLLGACALAFTFTTAAAAAKPKSIPAQIRVVDSTGETLAQQTQYTGSGVKFKSDPKATCFGPDDGGSGATIDLPGANALGLLADAGTTDRDVRPLSVSDAFDFGLALCGVGQAVSPDTGFWYLKQNHAASQTGGDATEVAKGDDILWYLIEDFNDPVPDELVLKAPATAQAGAEFPVQVVSYADDGTRTPAKGVKITGAGKPTDASGEAIVTADQDLLELTGTRKGSITSNQVVVCTLATAKCPAGYSIKVGGTKGDDRIVTGKLAETIVSGAGDDRIDVSRGSAGDLVKCGSGKDTVTVSRASPYKLVGCERLRPRR